MTRGFAAAVQVVAMGAPPPPPFRRRNKPSPQSNNPSPQSTLKSADTRTARNLFLTPHPHTSGRAPPKVRSAPCPVARSAEKTLTWRRESARTKSTAARTGSRARHLLLIVLPLFVLLLAFPAAAQTAGGASANPLTGENNVALGQGTLQYIQGGTNGNTAVGVYALNSLTTGTSNTALGYNAGHAITTGTDNTLIGYESGYGVKGSHNIELGEDPSSAITTGSSNILIGNSLSNVTNTSNTQLDIGDLIMGSISGRTPEVGIGTKTYQGQGLTVSGKVWATQFEMTSDARLKTDISPLVDSLSRIEHVKGVTFEWKSPEAREIGKDMSLPLNQPQMGVLAQDVEAVFPEAVTTGPNGLKSVNYESLAAPLIEAVKTLKRQNEILTRRDEVLMAAVGLVYVALVTLTALFAALAVLFLLRLRPPGCTRAASAEKT